MTAAVASPPMAPLGPVRPMGPFPGTPGGLGPNVQPTCPTCGREVAGLLALCWQADCLTAYLNEDRRYARLDDI